MVNGFYYSKIVVHMEDDGSFTPVEAVKVPYDGVWGKMCGATAAQNQLASAQASYYTTETNIANQEYADESGLFSTMTAMYTPIFNAGPSQYGFSAAETNALNSEAATGTAEDYNDVSQAVKEQIAAEGGATETPSGVQGKMAQETATAGAQQLSQEQQQIIEAGYQQGFQNWEAAAAGLGEAGSVFSTANQAAGVANQGGTAASQTESDIAQENDSVFSSIMGGLTGGITSVIDQNPHNIFG